MLDEVAAPEASRFEWLLHARDKMTLEPATNSIGIVKGIARLDVQLLSPPPGQLTFKQTDAFTPPVASGYEKRMPNEWHITAETTARSKSQDFFSVLYPHRNGFSAEDAVIRNIKTRRGFGLGVKTRDSNDRVFLAKERDASIRADGVEIEGLAGIFSTPAGAPGSEQRVSLVATTRIRSEILEFESSEPLNVDATITTTNTTLQFASPKAATLTLRQRFEPRTLLGVRKDDWIYDEVRELLTIKLTPQTTSIRLEPARPIDADLTIKF